MGKHKQETISRFFAPKSKSTANQPPSSPPQATPSSSSSPKITTTVAFSPSKRKLLSNHLSSTPKRSKLSPHTQNPLPSLHQRFLDKLLEPETARSPEPQNPQKFTPLEQQVLDLKQKYPDVLLMIEVGYKFRFFGEDAEVAARVLGIYAHTDHNFMTASIPTFRLNVHVRRLVSEGYKVGVVKQTETAAIKAHGENKSGPFTRGLSALYTKATLEAAQDVGGREERCGGENNYLCCVVEKSLDCGVYDARIGVVAVEISTGDVVYGEFDEGIMRSGLEAFVLSLAPAELLLGDPLSKQTEKLLLAYSGPASNVCVERISRDCFNAGGALADVMSLYENMLGDNLGDDEKKMNGAKEQESYHLAIEGVMKMPDLAVQALALTIRHLKQFGFDRMLCLGASFRPFSSNMEMNLSANTLQQLEVLRNNSDGSDSGSLLHVMNHTLTIYGSRLLRHWVARARKAVQLAKDKLDSLIGLYRKQLGMRNLEFMGVSGITHLVELALDVKVPLNWVEVNSTKKMIRYHPPEVLTALDQLSLANEELMVVSRAAWDSFLRGFGKYYAKFRGAVQALAALDCLHSFATLLKNKNYVRPVFVDDSEPLQINICSGRHPVLETILLDNFVPNDTNLHADKEHCQIITGPNMGGKSCYIRQVALIALMAQVGSFVPASSAKLHVLDGIYTRMGASDSIQQGRSTFLEELSEASHILQKCTAQSLVIIDELGRGTSTHDGGAIAYATLHHLLDQKRCMVLFVTHYPRIAEIKTEFPGSVGAYHVSYLTAEKNKGAMKSKCDVEDVTYLYKLVHGVAEKSFGFKVAQLAQLPPECIRRATIMAARLETVLSSRLGKEKLLLTLPIDHQEEARENMLTIPESFRTERIKCAEDLDDAYREFFSKLNPDMLDEDDATKSFQFLKKARSIAKELLGK